MVVQYSIVYKDNWSHIECGTLQVGGLLRKEGAEGGEASPTPRCYSGYSWTPIQLVHVHLPHPIIVTLLKIRPRIVMDHTASVSMYIHSSQGASNLCKSLLGLSLCVMLVSKHNRDLFVIVNLKATYYSK